MFNLIDTDNPQQLRLKDLQITVKGFWSDFRLEGEQQITLSLNRDAKSCRSARTSQSYRAQSAGLSLLGEISPPFALKSIGEAT